MYEEKFMREAIRLAVENVKQGTGGPFGAVVVKEGKIIAACANTVTPDCDPTAHAEVNAIREAYRSIPFLNEKEDTAGEEFSLWKESKDKTVY